MEFKENLRYLRHTNKMSQDELADKLGYKSFTTVQKWEDGTAFPRVSTLNKIADIFNIDVLFCVIFLIIIACGFIGFLTVTTSGETQYHA